MITLKDYMNHTYKFDSICIILFINYF